jgi:hypothetical protein
MYKIWGLDQSSIFHQNVAPTYHSVGYHTSKHLNMNNYMCYLLYVNRQYYVQEYLLIPTV